MKKQVLMLILGLSFVIIGGVIASSDKELEVKEADMSYNSFLEIFSNEETKMPEISNKRVFPDIRFLSLTDRLLLNQDSESIKREDIKYVRYSHMNSSFKMKTEGHYYTIPSPQNGELKEFFLLNDIEVKNPSLNISPAKILFDLLFAIFPFALFIIIMLYIVRGRMGGMTKAQTALDSSTKPSVSFTMIAGHKETKKDLKPLISFLKEPHKYSGLGARLPKGVILYGPPGTGKTMLAKAMAGEANIPFFATNASEFVEMYVGVGASRVRSLFKKARENAPCIVFIDELEALAKDKSIDNNSEREQTLKQLLTELDGFSTTEGILVVGATNDLSSLNQTFIRSGRFDRHVAVGLPDRYEREEILKIHSKKKIMSKEVSLSNLAKKTTGLSGADLETVLNEAALLATLESKKEIDNQDIENAFYKITMKGYKKNTSNIEDKQLELVAWHEAGHTIIAKEVAKLSVTNVNIIPSTSGAGGVTFIEPRESGLQSKKDLKNDIKIAYGGRAAEELFFGNNEDITTGAHNDIKQATQKIKAMIMACGMSEMGMLDLTNFGGSEEKILEEAKKIASELYKETYEYLKENKEKLERLVEGLKERETLEEKEIKDILEDD